MMGSFDRPMTFAGFSRSSSVAAMAYCRIGPTPCVSINQPSGVSTGDPQLPMIENSHQYFGASDFRPWFQTNTSSDSRMYRFTPSSRPDMTYFPLIRRGNSAMPLFFTNLPAMVWLATVLRSLDMNSDGKPLMPLYAV